MKEFSFNGSIFYVLILPFFLVTLLLSSSTLLAHSGPEAEAGHVDNAEAEPEITPEDDDIALQSVASIADAVSEGNHERVLDFVAQENYQLRQDILNSLRESKIQDYHFNDITYNITTVEDNNLQVTIEFIASGSGWKHVGIAIFIFSRVEVGPQNTSDSTGDTAYRWLITETDFHKKIISDTAENTKAQYMSRLILFIVIYAPLITATVIYTFYKRSPDFAIWIIIMLGLPVIGLVLFWANRMYTAMKQRIR